MRRSRLQALNATDPRPAANASPSKQLSEADAFRTQMTAVATSRRVHTRQLERCDADVWTVERAKLANVLESIYDTLVNVQCPALMGGTLSELLNASPRQEMNGHPEPRDLEQLRSLIKRGRYESMLAFEADLFALLRRTFKRQPTPAADRRRGRRPDLRRDSRPGRGDRVTTRPGPGSTVE